MNLLIANDARAGPSSLGTLIVAATRAGACRYVTRVMSILAGASPRRSVRIAVSASADPGTRPTTQALTTTTKDDFIVTERVLIVELYAEERLRVRRSPKPASGSATARPSPATQPATVRLTTERAAMLRGFTVALVATLTVALTATAAPAVGPAPAPAAPSGEAGARGWHVTGHWKGLRDNTLGFKMRSHLRIKRNDAGRLRGTGVYRSTRDGSVLCRTKLRFVKRTKNGWRVFRERTSYDSGHCGNGRTRLHKWPKNRLKAYWFDGSGIREEGTLHRP